MIHRNLKFRAGPKPPGVRQDGRASPPSELSSPDSTDEGAVIALLLMARERERGREKRKESSPCSSPSCRAECSAERYDASVEAVIGEKEGSRPFEWGAEVSD